MSTAPRITLNDVMMNIATEYYFTVGDGVHGAGLAAGKDSSTYPDRFDRMTICILVLRNGFTVTGESVCVSAENFNAAVGRKSAFDNALDKVWPLMGYELTSRLAAGEMSHSGGGDPAGVVPQR